MENTTIRFLRTYWFVLIIPTIVAIISFFMTRATGPYWQYGDPSYSYLMNSLNIGKGLTPVHIDHPGTPLQILGWVVIWVLNLGHSTQDMVNKALANPEFYLHAIHCVLMVMFFITSVALGVYTYQKTQDRLAAILIQLPGLIFLTLKCFASAYPVLPIISNVGTEPLHISIANLFCICFLKLYFSGTKKEEWVAVALLAGIFGIGIATKLTFVLLLILPLILLDWPKKIALIAVSMVSFVLWTTPILSVYPKLWKWTADIFNHTGIYGSSGTGIINTHEYVLNWTQHILRQYWCFVFIALATVTWSGWRILVRQASKGIYYLWVISLGVLFEFAVVAKHYDDHYLLLGFALLGMVFFFFYLTAIAKDAFLKCCAWGFIFLFTAFYVVTALIYRSHLSALTHDNISFYDEERAKYPTCQFISYPVQPPLRNPDYALFIGNEYSLGEKEELNRIYPHTLYFDIDSTDDYGIWNFKEKVAAEDIMAANSCVVFIGSGFDFSDSPYIVKPLDQGTLSNTYLLVGSTEREGTALFNAAQAAYAQGNYPQAFALALKSRQLNAQPKGKVEYFLLLVSNLLKH